MFGRDLTRNPSDNGPGDAGQSLQPNATSSPSDACRSAPADLSHLSGTSLVGNSLDEARTLLMGQHLGISYAEVMRSLAKSSWVFAKIPHTDSLDLTGKLVNLHPQLAQEYRALTSSEGVIAYVLAAIPFVGRPRASEEFLKANKGLNQIVSDLEQGGLLEVRHHIVTVSGIDSRVGGMGLTNNTFFTLALTDLGNLALKTSQ